MDTFDVILVNTHKKTAGYAFNNPTEHLGLAYIAAFLESRSYSVDIIDAYALNRSTDEVFEEVNRNPPRLFVGITCEFNTFEEARNLASKLRADGGAFYTVLGGEHATFASEDILSEDEEFDFIVRGEGELTSVELADAIEGLRPFESVPGLWFRGEDGGIVRNPDREAIPDLDKLPFPSRITLRKCLAQGLAPAISMLASRGCPAKCAFCNAHKFFNLGGGRAWRARSPENIVEEIEALLPLYSEDIYPVIYFADENFVGPKRKGLKRVRRFARLLIERELGISYEIFCRTDSFYDQEDLVRELRESGLISVLMGVEAGSDTQLKALQKGSKVNHNAASIEIFNSNGIATSSSGFLMFNPYSTFEDLRRNAQFLLQINQSTLYNMSCRVYAYPGIAINDDFRRDGLMMGDFSHFKTDRIGFVDKSVQTLATLLNENIDFELMRREDSTMRHIDLSILRFSGQLGSDLLNIAENERVLKNVRNDVQKISNEFFLEMVSEGENRRLSDTGFESAYRSYCAKLTNGLDILAQHFEWYLHSIQSELIA
jgi:anaerobic magnesium-protoporphyrin IX monomethyl ester cyclase